MENILATLYPIAAQIASPLGIASTTILLFFGISKYVISSMEVPIKRITGNHAFIILISIISYGFIIALIALAGALAAWGTKYIYEEFYLRSELIRKGEQAVSRRESNTAIRIGQDIVSQWPEELAGYKILGHGFFINYEYSEAASVFQNALNVIGESDTPCEGNHKNFTLNVSAALGAVGSTARALEQMESIEGCSLGAGANFNLAKLHLIEGKIDKTLTLLEKPELNSKGPPDYRDRAHFLRAIAYIEQSHVDDSDVTRSVFDELNAASCLNEEFRGVILGIAKAGAGSPDGDLSQDFAFEQERIKSYLTTPMRAELIKTISDLSNCD